jgi:RNase P subunit RPR2
MKKCRLCKKMFDQKEKGRLRIAKKEDKGESIAWLCPQCAGRIRIG